MILISRNIPFEDRQIYSDCFLWNADAQKMKVVCDTVAHQQDFFKHHPPTLDTSVDFILPGKAYWIDSRGMQCLRDTLQIPGLHRLGGLLEETIVDYCRDDKRMFYDFKTTIRVNSKSRYSYWICANRGKLTFGFSMEEGELENLYREVFHAAI